MKLKRINVADTKFSIPLILVIFLCWLAEFAIGVSFFSIPPIINEIKKSFIISNAEVGLLLACPNISFIFFSFLIGILVDKWGSYKSSLISLGLMAIAGILKGLSVNYWQFLVLTFIQSFSVLIIGPAIIKTIKSKFPKQHYGKATGIVSTGMATGIIFVFFLTPLIHFFWKWIILLYSSIPLLVLVVYLSNRSIIESSDQLTEQNFAFSSIIIKDWRVYCIGLFYFVTTFIYFGLTSWLPQFLEQKNFPFQSSWASALMILTGIFSAIVIPSIFDRLKNKIFFIRIVMISLGLSIYFLIKISGVYIIFVIAFIGVCNGPMRPMLNVMAMHLVNKKQEIGKIMGLLLTLGNIGGFLGSWLIGLIRDINHSFFYGFFLLTILSIIVAVIPIKSWKMEEDKRYSMVKN